MSDETKPEGSQQPPDEPLKPAGSGDTGSPELPSGQPAGTKSAAPPSDEKTAQPASPTHGEVKPAAPATAPSVQPVPAGGAKPAAAPPPKPVAPKAPAVMQTATWEGDLPDKLRAEFGEKVLEFLGYVGQEFLVAVPDATVPILQYLKADCGFDYLVDVTAVDYPDKPERFALVYVVYSFARNERIRIKTRVKEGYKPATAVKVHITADWLEREVFDMFGIEFEGHPNMKRILLPDEWTGHPLRKDYGILQMDNRWVQEHLGIESGQ